MAESILRLRIDSAEYDNKIKRASDGLQRYMDECRKAGGTLTELDDGVEDFVKALGRMETVNKSARGSIAEMTKSFTDLSSWYNKLTEEEKNATFGKSLAQSLDVLKGRIQDGKRELADINRELNGSGGLSGALDSIASKFGLNISQLTKLGGALAAGSAALKVTKDAFMNTEEGIDEWGRTMKGAESIYQTFLDTLNGGNWSNFFANLSDAVKGARDLYDAFDRVQSIKANNQVAVAMAQAELQNLRLLKQQGKDVDDQIKAVSKRLYALQNQGSQAGIQAGRESVQLTLRNAINTTEGGRGVISDRSIETISDQIARGGQKIFDQAKKKLAALEAKAQDTRTVSRSYSTTGISQEYKEQYTNLNKLTDEEKKQYLISKAITEKETQIQQGLGVWAQSVTERSSALREEFRANRYALQGSGSGSDKNLVQLGIKGVKEMEPAAFGVTESMKELQEALNRYRDMLNNAKDSYTYNQAAAGIAQTQKQMSVQPVAARLGMSTESYMQLQDDMRAKIDEMTENLPPVKIEVTAEGVNNVTKDVQKMSAAWSTAGSVIGSVGSAIKNIEDPTAKIVAIVAEAIANIASGYGAAIGKEGKNSKNIWAFIASAVAAIASMGVAISQVHKSTGYAQGGIVPGNFPSNDLLDGRSFGIESGELILNRAQQSNIANQLKATGFENMNLETYISGEQLRIVLNRNSLRRGKGEYITSKQGY